MPSMTSTALIEKVTAVFPCFTFLQPEDGRWGDSVTVGPATPHPIRPGHVLQHAAFVLRGRVRIYQLNEQGREITLYRLQGGECCSLMLCSILGELAYEASIEVECETELFIVAVPQFKTWLAQEPALKQFIFKEITSRIIDVTRLVDDMAFKSIPHRLAAFLLKETGSGEREVSMTHEQVAVELGTAREVVSRGLKELERQGLISLARGSMTIMDRQRLEYVTKSR